MLSKLMEWTLRNRLLVLLLFAVGVVVGAWTLSRLPVDAFPDTSPIQVQINTVASALSPEQIEQQITLPVELSISGLPGLVHVRSISKFGLSQVVATFDDDASMSDARQYIGERLSTVELPAGIERPELGPISSGLGEVFHYVVRSDNPQRSLEQLRTLHDWVIKPELRKIPGVAEVNAWGGFEKQYHVVVKPSALLKHNLTLDDVFTALEENNENVGGGLLTQGGESLVVHGVGRVNNVEEIGNVVITAYEGTPILIRDVAEVQIDHAIRRGAVTYQGEGEVVMGLAFMLLGENSKEVTAAIKQRLVQIEKYLPDDVDITTVYDRTQLVEQVIDTVQENLLAGAVLVVIVLLILLGSIRAGLIVALAIPLAMLFAVLGMYEFAIAASLLSLGAIDFGIIVDGSVVMTESNMRALMEEQNAKQRPLTHEERLQSIVRSSQQVVRPILFGMGIIIIVFFPILGLQGVEGKMFKPMAWTFIFALLGGLLVALFLSPVLSYYMLSRRVRTGEGWFDRWLHHMYESLLALAMKLRWGVLAGVVALLVFSGWQASRLGGEFIPRLSEGAIVINTIRLAGVSLEDSIAYNTQIEQEILKKFPNEIKHVWSRIGTAEVATDPMGLELSDIFMTLHPRESWERAGTQAELVGELQEELSSLPGLNMVYTQPIELRVNELASGVRSDIAIKIFGDDFDELVRLGDEVQHLLLELEGVSDISSDQVTGQPMLRIEVDQKQIARYGISTKDVLEFVETVGAHEVGEVYEGQRGFSLVVRLPDEYRQSMELLADTLIPTRVGPTIPLRQVSHIERTAGYATINREWGRRLIRVQCNVAGRDTSSFVAEAQQLLDQKLRLPEGYVIDWGGQFENLRRAQLRLSVLIPITLLLVFFMLYFSLKRWRDVLLIYTGIPFAVVGGVLALSWRGMPFSVSAAVGFIALCGIAVLNGQLLISTVRTFRDEGVGVLESVTRAASQRLRPVLATAITDAAGFIPMAISTGVGAEVQRPLATVVVGGVLTSTALTLFVLPILCRIVDRQDRRSPASQSKA